MEEQGYARSGDCAISEFQSAVSGKWKIAILWALSKGTLRFGELNRQIPGITHSILTKQLRELEAEEAASDRIGRYQPGGNGNPTARIVGMRRSTTPLIPMAAI